MIVKESVTVLEVKTFGNNTYGQVLSYSPLGKRTGSLCRETSKSCPSIRDPAGLGERDERAVGELEQGQPHPHPPSCAKDGQPS